MKRWYVEQYARTGTRAQWWKMMDMQELRRLVHQVRADGNKFIVRIIEPLDVTARELMELHSLGVHRI
jgi:hypothetical protein